VQAALERHEIGAQEHRARLVRAGAHVALHDRDPIARHDGCGRRVRDRGGDLQARPQAAEPGEELRVQPEVEDVLRIGRVQRRDRQVRERCLAGARHAGRLGSRIVADQSDSATGGARARQVRVAQGIGGAVEAGGLAVPDAHDAVAP
jgi:hypothetical protein